jgi:hypothetical protein
MYAAPFGSLQNDTPPIQYGDPSSGPTQGGINALANSPPQPIAQPFGMLPTAGLTPEPPAPSFNVETGTPTPIGWVPTRLGSILGAALTPSQQGVDATMAAPADAAKWWARKLGVSRPSPAPSSAGFIADTLGAPADAAAWAARRMGVTVPENVPGGSQYFQNLMDNPPHAEINALMQALRRRF